MRGHISKHYNGIRLLRLDYCELNEKLQLLVGNTFTSILLKSIEKSLHKEHLESFKTKNKKIANLMKNQKDYISKLIFASLFRLKNIRVRRNPSFI